MHTDGWLLFIMLNMIVFTYGVNPKVWCFELLDGLIKNCFSLSDESHHSKQDLDRILDRGKGKKFLNVRLIL